MAATNLNFLAARVAAREGKKKQVNIAQIKETIKATLEELRLLEDRDVIIILNRYRSPWLRTPIERKRKPKGCGM